MIKSKFKEAFRRGLGSAYIELKNCISREKYKDIVLWCCLHNTCYDAQCEGGRGIYLYEAISLYDDKRYFEEAIIEQFLKREIDTWLFDQFCDLLVQFALDGSIRARNALYAKYDALTLLILNNRDKQTDKDNYEWLCVWLTSLDGFRAFKRIAERIGELLIGRKDKSTLNFSWFYCNSQNKFGTKRVDKYLLENVTKSLAIKTFFDEVVYTENQSSRSNNSTTLQELIEACNQEKGFRNRFIAIRFARTASQDDLVKLAQVALKETNLDKKVSLLWAFRNTRFPLDEKFVFELAEDNNQSIRDIAFEMMGHLSSERVHDYVVDLVKQEKEMASALSLLCHCYKNEDEKLLVEGIKNLSVSYDDGGWHGAFMEVERLLEKRTLKVDPSLFIYVYRKTLCSSCRSRIVQGMSKRKILPDEILEECLYDSYEDTRKFAERKMRVKA